MDPRDCTSATQRRHAVGLGTVSTSEGGCLGQDRRLQTGRFALPDERSCFSSHFTFVAPFLYHSRMRPHMGKDEVFV